MHNYLPSLKQMQYLVALHEHGHFGRAADGCNVTQSTLSAGIRELETLLGQTLVERTRRVVRFTGLGNAIVEKAHRVLREAEELADMAAAAAAPDALAASLAGASYCTPRRYGPRRGSHIIRAGGRLVTNRDCISAPRRTSLIILTKLRLLMPCSVDSWAFRRLVMKSLI